MEALTLTPSLSLEGRGGRSVALLVVSILYAVLAIRQIAAGTYYPRFDSGGFITAAASLAQGKGYRDLTAPVTRPDEGWTCPPEFYRRLGIDLGTPGHPFFRTYPAVVPAIYSVFIRLFGVNFAALQSFMAAAGLGCVWMTWGLFRRSGHARLATPAAVLTALSLHFVFSLRLQSEVIGLAFVLGALAAWDRWWRSRTLLNGYFLAGAALAILAWGSRLIAVAVLAGLALHFVLTGLRAWKMNLVRLILACAVVGGPMVVYVHFLLTPGLGRAAGAAGADDPYLAWAGETPPEGLPDKVSGNVLRLVQALPLACFPVTHSPERADPYYAQFELFRWPFWLCLLVGMAAVFRRGPRLADSFCVAYLAGCQLLSWQELRFYVMVVPMVWLYLLTGLRLIAGVVHRRIRVAATASASGQWRHRAVWAVTVVLLAVQARMIRTDDHTDDQWDARGNALYTAAQWIRDNTPQDSVVMTWDNFGAGVVSGRACISYAEAEWKNFHTGRYLAAGGRVDWAVLHSAEHLKFVQELLDRYGRKFRVTRRDGPCVVAVGDFQ